MSNRVFSWCLGAGACLLGSTVFANLAVDRAGTTFVEFRPVASLSTAMTFDANGGLLHCKTVVAGPQVQPRLDGPGFLLLTRSPQNLLVPQIDLLDGLGQTQWSFVLPVLQFPPGVAPGRDGGAWVWTSDSKLVRLDRRGQMIRQSDVPRGPSIRRVGLTEVDFGRVFFADSNTFGFPGGPIPASFGVINADGTTAWHRTERRGHFTLSKLMPLSNGDFWRFASFDSTLPDTFESKLQRWTPWGMKLTEHKGPTLVPGLDITQPALDGDDIWFLARRLSRPEEDDSVFARRLDQLELVRLGALGIQSRQLVLPSFDTETGRNSGTLSAANGAAWVSVSGPNGANFVQYFTRAGTGWKRFYEDLRASQLIATSQGDARLSFLDRDSKHWLVKLSPRGAEVWRVSLDAIANGAACRP